MTQRCVAAVAVLTIVAWLGTVLTASGQAAGAKTTETIARAMRTPWGDPDLQGTWTNWHQVPLERPANLSDKLTLTAEEVAALEQQAAERERVERPPAPGDTGFYNSFWNERGERINRTSLIVDPPNGRLPFNKEAVQQQAARQQARFPRPNATPPVNSWEDRDAYERCITRGMPGAMIPAYYNHNYQIRRRSRALNRNKTSRSVSMRPRRSRARTDHSRAAGPHEIPARPRQRPKTQPLI